MMLKESNGTKERGKHNFPCIKAFNSKARRFPLECCFKGKVNTAGYTFWWSCQSRGGTRCAPRSRTPDGPAGSRPGGAHYQYQRYRFCLHLREAACDTLFATACAQPTQNIVADVQEGFLTSDLNARRLYDWLWTNLHRMGNNALRNRRSSFHRYEHLLQGPMVEQHCNCDD